ncbi:hypothetical protein [Streptomyces sp. NPDC056165]|uniref:hypothetical protein n=1 Tax=Streptomyces sp. NPDC056165 TaxID=3345733 RepID=UPI0035DA8FF0
MAILVPIKGIVGHRDLEVHCAGEESLQIYSGTATFEFTVKGSVKKEEVVCFLPTRNGALRSFNKVQAGYLNATVIAAMDSVQALDKGAVLAVDTAGVELQNIADPVTGTTSRVLALRAHIAAHAGGVKRLAYHVTIHANGVSEEKLFPAGPALTPNAAGGDPIM